MEAIMPPSAPSTPSERGKQLVHELIQEIEALGVEYDKKFGAQSKDEADPNEVDAHAAGAKLDAGKPRVGLVVGGFARALEEVAKVGTFGANKYSDNGWMEVKDGIKRYTDAMGRHWLAECRGEIFDSGPGGTKCRHAAQVAWNALARLDLMIREEEKRLS